MNLLHGKLCPSVVCQHSGPAFRYLDEQVQVWIECDDLPTEIAQALPGPEWDRCEYHRIRRLGDRRAA